MKFTEDKLEQAVIELFETEQLDAALSGFVAGYAWEVGL